MNEEFYTTHNIDDPWHENEWEYEDAEWRSYHDDIDND